MKGSLVLEKIEAGIKEGSAQIAQELEDNVERYGVAPVIAMDGKLKNLRAKILDIAELDILKLLKKYNYDEDDFYFLEDKKAKYIDGKSVLLQGYIICVCKKSGKLKEYHANGGSSWIEDFTLDLKNKFFTN